MACEPVLETIEPMLEDMLLLENILAEAEFEDAMEKLSLALDRAHRSIQETNSFIKEIGGTIPVGAS
jgi:hypothetical protein